MEFYDLHWWVAALVFFISFAGSYTFILVLEKDLNTSRESNKKGNITDPNV